MLVELESAARPMERSAAGGFSTGWAVVLALLVTAAGGAWWWSQQRVADASERGDSRPVAAAPAPETIKPVQGASAAAESASNTARIEALLEPRPAEAAMPATAAVVAAPLVAAAAPVASAAAAAPAARAIKSVPKHTHASTRVARRAPALDATAATNAADRAGATNKDADIVLLSALLAHVSRDGQAGPLASNDQVTIAQIVQRCEARGGDDARQCRRRICEGYWGKAQACPASLAPKKG